MNSTSTESTTEAAKQSPPDAAPSAADSAWTGLKSRGQKVLDRLPGGRFTRHVALLASTTVVSQVVGFAAAPILTRLYSPSDFGLLGVYASMLGFLVVVISLRYEYAVPLPEQDEDAAALVLLGLAIIPFSVGALILVVWLFQDQLILYTNAPELVHYLWILPLSAAPVGAFQIFNAWAIRKRAFGRIATTKLTQSIGCAGTQIALFPLGPLGLLLGHLFGRAAGITTLATMAMRQDGNVFRGLRLRNLSQMAVRYRRFPQVSCISGLISASAFQFPLLLLAAAYGPVIAGQFVLVQRVIGWPMAILGRGVAQVYVAECASVARSSPESLRQLYLSSSKHLALLSILPMAFLVAFGRWLLPFVFGEEWADAGCYAQLLAPTAAVQLVFFPLASTLNVLERQTWYLCSDIFRAGLVITSIGIPAYLGWAPVWVIASYAGSLFLGYAILWGVQLYAIDLHASQARGKSELPSAG